MYKDARTRHKGNEANCLKLLNSRQAGKVWRFAEKTHGIARLASASSATAIRVRVPRGGWLPNRAAYAAPAVQVTTAKYAQTRGRFKNSSGVPIRRVSMASASDMTM